MTSRERAFRLIGDVPMYVRPDLTHEQTVDFIEQVRACLDAHAEDMVDLHIPAYKVLEMTDRVVLEIPRRTWERFMRMSYDAETAHVERMADAALFGVPK